MLKNSRMDTFSVMPAKAGIQKLLIALICFFWTPAFAGVTKAFSTSY